MPAKVVRKTISEIYDVVLNSHDLTVTGTAVRRSSETTAYHLHV